MKNSVFIGITILLISTSSLSAYGDNYFIATNGNNSNNGSINYPWQTLVYAASQVQPGDTIFVRDGNYHEGEIWINLNFGMGGADGNYVTIKAYENEIPVFDNPNSPLIISAKYVRIQGLHFSGKIISVRRITDVGMSEYIQIINNTFIGQSSPPIYLNCNYGLVENNVIDIASTSGSHGIYIMHGNGSVVRGNTVIGAYSYGIHVYDENKYQYAGENNPKITNLLIEGNFVKNSQARSGIIISAGESHSLAIEINNVVIRNNIVIHSAACGLAMYYYGTIRNVQMYNNNFFNNSTGIQIDAVDVDDIEINNNIFSENRQRHIDIHNVPNVTVSHNLYHDPQSVGIGINDTSPVFGDPLFVDKYSDDFHLLAGSPAIGAGTDVGIPFIGDKPDIGAFEFDGTTSVNLSAFTAVYKNNKVQLSWRTLWEINNYGFEIERSNDKLNFVKIGFIPGAGSSKTDIEYVFLDDHWDSNVYYYRLRQINTDGSHTLFGPVEVHLTTPRQFQLLQNYPNPFNPSTTIKYNVPERSKVSITIFNVKGQKITTLFNDVQEAGWKEVLWDGKNDADLKVPSGIYFCLLLEESFNSMIKLVLLP